MSSISIRERTSLGALRDTLYEFVSAHYPSGGRFCRAIEGGKLVVAYPTPTGAVHHEYAVAQLPPAEAVANIRNALIALSDGIDDSQQALKAAVLVSLVAFETTHAIGPWQSVVTTFDTFVTGLRVFPASSKRLLLLGSFLGAGALLAGGYYFFKRSRR